VAIQRESCRLRVKYATIDSGSFSMGIDRLFGLGNAALNALQSSQTSALKKQVASLQASQAQIGELQEQILALQQQN